MVHADTSACRIGRSTAGPVGACADTAKKLIFRIRDQKGKTFGKIKTVLFILNQ